MVWLTIITMLYVRSLKPLFILFVIFTFLSLIENISQWLQQRKYAIIIYHHSFIICAWVEVIKNRIFFPFEAVITSSFLAGGFLLLGYLYSVSNGICCSCIYQSYIPKLLQSSLRLFIIPIPCFISTFLYKPSCVNYPVVFLLIGLLYWWSRTLWLIKINN